MHKKATPPAKTDVPAGACPYVPPSTTSTSTSPPPPQAAPDAPAPSFLSRLNPLNNMFSDLDNTRASTQTQSLPLSRETSTIPKSDGSLWEYPSPQQMYNAMLRKGYTDTDVTAVESMVSVHNFLNEGAWAEIMGWERRFSRGVIEGYKICKQGEERANAALGTAEDPFDTTTWTDNDIPPPKLLRFTGRPTDPTPKATLMQWAAWAAPARFGTAPPFDRHDWFVERCNEKGCREVRYVIDYYEGAPEETGEPVFFLDVRPAVDGPGSAAERMVRWGTDVFWRASGGEARILKRVEERRREREELEGRGRRQYN